ncbi:Peptidase C14 caspase domain-containing protein OS=Lysinibacillus sphaericus OX=1421 GN=LS41612_10725 PE=4 SV=1 [Lysinibacillus sphaericus]
MLHRLKILQYFIFQAMVVLICGGHEIFLSDDSIETEQIIGILESSRSKNNLVILDCCYAGKIDIEIKTASIEKNLFEIVGKGTEIFCACKDDEKAYGYEGIGGFFTQVFSKALEISLNNIENGLTIRDFTNYIRRVFEMGLRQIAYKQTFVQIGNTIGDFYLIEPQPKTYKPKSVYYEFNDYIIEEVKDTHSGRNKRYSVKVLLKYPFTIDKIKMISDEILSLSTGFEVYNNEKLHNRLSKEIVSHIFCYFGFTKEDMLNSNYYCRSVWVDKSQNRSHWLKKVENSQLLGETLFIYNTSYFVLKNFINSNTRSDIEIFELANAIKTDAINIGQIIINKYHDFLNKKIFEYELIAIVDSYTTEIERLIDQSVNLGYTTERLKKWMNKLVGMVGTLSDFILYYGSKYVNTRDVDNRKQCMNSSIKSFNSDLDSLANIEVTLTEFF